MPVNKFFLPILTVLALFGSYLIARASGVWSVSGKQSINVEQMTTGADVRGWMTLEQLSSGYAIPQDDLYILLGIPAEIAPETALKDLEGVIPDFEISVVRERIDAHLAGSPAPITTPSPVLPEPQAPAVSPTPTSHTPQSSGGESASGPTPLPAGIILPAAEIKGRHTLLEISEQCQVALPELLLALGLPPGTGVDTPIKDLVGTGALTEIQVIRDAVTALQQR